MIKRVTPAFLILIILFSSPGLAFEETTRSAMIQNQINQYRQQAAESLQSYKQASGERKIQALKNYGIRAIELRLRWIEKLQDRIQNLNIDEDMRQILITDLNNNASGISALKGKIEAEIDLETLKNDVRAIFVDYRIFLVVLPRNHGRLAAARLGLISQIIVQHEEKIDELVASLKAAGADTNPLESLVSEFKTQVDQAESNIQAADDQFVQMTPTDTEAAKTQLQTGREFLHQAVTNFQSAKETLGKIKIEVKNLRDWLKNSGQE